MNRSLLLLCIPYRFCTCSTVNIICDCLWVFVVIVFNFFKYIHTRVCLNETVCVFCSVPLFGYVCWGAFNIFFIVFHLVFTSVPYTCSMLFGNARIHRDCFFLIRSLSVSLAVFLFAMSPPLTLTLAISLPFTSFLFLSPSIYRSVSPLL